MCTGPVTLCGHHVLMTRLTFTELEELVRSDPDVDPDEAMEYGDWLAMCRPAPRRGLARRLRGLLRGLPSRRAER